MVNDLQRLAEARALVGRQRKGEHVAVVDEGFAAPRRAADLDDLLDPGQGLGIGHTVEALNDLGA